jgi:hypothetical protein
MDDAVTGKNKNQPQQRNIAPNPALKNASPSLPRLSPIKPVSTQPKPK